MSAVDRFGNSFLQGTPTASSSGTYTVTATDSSGNIGSIQAGITASKDVVTLTPFADPQLTFVIGRPLSNALDGYYSSNLSLTATSSTGQALTFSYPQFKQAGITATVANNVITFSGTPTTLVPSIYASVSASDSIPPPYNAYAAIPILFSVVDDVFTWAQVSATFQQNRVITPVQLSATTLSGRVITSYTCAGLPQGLTCTRNGLIRGTCLGASNGTFTATASTGISTHSRLYTYSVDPDTIFITTPASSYSLVPGGAISPIQTLVVSHSGLPVTSYSLTAPTYGLTIGSSTGLLAGTLNPGSGLVSSALIPLNAVVGGNPLSVNVTLTSTTIPVNGELAIGSNLITPIYTYSNAPIIANGAVGTAVSGGSQANPYGDTATNAASDIQMNGRNVVGSFAQAGSRGATIFGGVVYGDATASLALSSNFPTRTFSASIPSAEWTLYRSAFSIAYSGSGSTWYALGQGYNTQADPSSNFGQVYLIASYDNGATWTPGYYTSKTPANWALAVRIATHFPVIHSFPLHSIRSITTLAQLSFGVQETSIWRVVGPIFRLHIPLRLPCYESTSMTGGTPPSGDNATIVPAWTRPTGYFVTETRDFALDGPVWVAAGSDSNTMYLRISQCVFDIEMVV
jgi:hypothetical protein